MLRDSVANRLTSVQRHLGLEFRFLSVALSYQAAQLAVVLASITYVPELFFLHHLTRTTGSAKACLLGLRFTLETGNLCSTVNCCSGRKDSLDLRRGQECFL
jgi:hypothetical protein